GQLSSTVVNRGTKRPSYGDGHHYDHQPHNHCLFTVTCTYIYSNMRCVAAAASELIYDMRFKTISGAQITEWNKDGTGERRNLQMNGLEVLADVYCQYQQIIGLNSI
ncbi:hypothetical protein X801_05776, partial [Opisthorchis viverrini]